MTKEQAAAIPQAQLDQAAKYYSELLSLWALEQAPADVRADMLNRAAIAAGISDEPFGPLRVDALLN